jgi:hypothetical protein
VPPQAAKRADKHARVEIMIKAGQIGIRGRPGPVGYEGAKGFAGPRGDRVTYDSSHCGAVRVSKACTMHPRTVNIMSREFRV